MQLEADPQRAAAGRRSAALRIDLAPARAQARLDFSSAGGGWSSSRRSRMNRRFALKPPRGFVVIAITSGALAGLAGLARIEAAGGINVSFAPAILMIAGIMGGPATALIAAALFAAGTLLWHPSAAAALPAAIVESRHWCRLLRSRALQLRGRWLSTVSQRCGRGRLSPRCSAPSSMSPSLCSR
jgi:hypothetical protein